MTKEGVSTIEILGGVRKRSNATCLHFVMAGLLFAAILIVRGTSDSRHRFESLFHSRFPKTSDEIAAVRPRVTSELLKLRGSVIELGHACIEDRKIVEHLSSSHDDHQILIDARRKWTIHRSLHQEALAALNRACDVARLAGFNEEAEVARSFK